MAQTLLTEQQAKDALNIENFHNFPKEKVMQLVSLLPQMDKEVALSIINQFPVYSELAQAMVEQLGQACDAAMAENSKSQDAVLSAYRKILDDLGEVLKRESITEEERDRISNKMIEIADKMAAKDSENKNFLAWITKNKEYIIGGAIFLGTTLFGVSLSEKGLPKLKK